MDVNWEMDQTIQSQDSMSKRKHARIEGTGKEKRTEQFIYISVSQSGLARNSLDQDCLQMLYPPAIYWSF